VHGLVAGEAEDVGDAFADQLGDERLAPGHLRHENVYVIQSERTTYGLSIFHLFDPDTLHSLAPFHHTPRGRQAIAALVTPAVRKLFAASRACVDG
jgi:hypothetical protein